MIAPLVVALLTSNGQIRVSSVAELRAALNAVKPGTRILIAPGEYAGGLHFSNLRGTEDAPITLAGADPQNPPRFKGGGSTLHFSRIRHMEIRDIVVSGGSGNGVNIDDGGSRETPSSHINLINLKVSDLPPGNHDGIKLSGVTDFLIQSCTVERWGGSAIDMVGCHRGLIQNSTFRRGGDNGVQTKGGTTEVVVRKCRFEDAGQRSVNIGGSTGLEFFRPPLSQMPSGHRFEAAKIVVEGSVFIGSVAPINFVGVREAIVRYNTIYHPKRWAVRILQETVAEGFLPCGRGEFSNNLVVFRSDQWFSGGVNIGGGTDSQSFMFNRNFWYCSDNPGHSRPTLPVQEQDGVYGADPLFVDAAKGSFELQQGSPAKRFGAGAFRQ